MNNAPLDSGPSSATSPASAMGRLEQLDRDVSRQLAVRLPRPRWLRLPLSGLSLAANYGILWYAIALLPWIAGRSDPLLRALYVAVPVTLVEASGYVIKLFIARPRPPRADPALDEQIPLPKSHSFPSSHASMGVVGTCAVAAMYPSALPALIALVAVLCFSRVYLGVHYAGDVLGGIAYGTLFGIVWILLVSPPG